MTSCELEGFFVPSFVCECTQRAHFELESSTQSIRMETDSEENSIVQEKQTQYLYPAVTGGKYLYNRENTDIQLLIA